jgi:hypothetical protein
MVYAFGFTTLRGHHPQHGLLSVLGILTCCTSLQCSWSFNGSGSFIATWPELQWWRNRELAIISMIQLWEFRFSEICHDLEVSSNRGTPKSSICRWIFHEINQPAIGDPHLWKSSFLRFFSPATTGENWGKVTRLWLISGGVDSCFKICSQGGTEGCRATNWGFP